MADVGTSSEGTPVPDDEENLPPADPNKQAAVLAPASAQFSGMMRAPRIMAAPSSAEAASKNEGVKLTMRKLSFDSHMSKLNKSRAKEEGEDDSGTIGGEGLPSLLKRLRQDAQEEIERATAASGSNALCLSREIRMMERERSLVEKAHELALDRLEELRIEQVASLEKEVARLKTESEKLREERKVADAARDATDARNAELLAELEQMRDQVRVANQRADAMEAASAFLQPEEEASPHVAKPRVGVVDENVNARRGRSVSGSVALINVPAMNGGRSSGLEGETFAAIRDPQLSRAGPPSPEPSGRERVQSLDGTPSKGGMVQRRFSFGRKAAGAGRTLRRSLSFGNDAPKREWGSAAN